MTILKGLPAAVAVGGVLVFGGLGAVSAQQETPPKIDVDRLAAELGLSDEARAELNRLNDLLVRRARVREEAIAIRTELSDVFSNVLARLTPEQGRRLRTSLRDQWAAAGMGPHMGGGMGGFGDGSGCWGDVQGMHGMDRMGHAPWMGHRSRN